MPSNFRAGFLQLDYLGVDDSPRNSPLGQVDDILKSQLDDLAPPVICHARGVRGDDDVLQRQERVIRQRRLAGENIERGPRNFFVPERLIERRFVDDAAARAVDDLKRGLGQRKLSFADNVFCLRV
jgi:hypothetical protein